MAWLFCVASGVSAAGLMCPSSQCGATASSLHASVSVDSESGGKNKLVTSLVRETLSPLIRSHVLLRDFRIAGTASRMFINLNFEMSPTKGRDLIWMRAILWPYSLSTIKKNTHTHTHFLK